MRLAARYYLDVSCPADEATRRALNVTTAVKQLDRDFGVTDVDGCDHGEYDKGRVGLRSSGKPSTNDEPGSRIS
jgi:hypothetical protein